MNFRTCKNKVFLTMCNPTSVILIFWILQIISAERISLEDTFDFIIVGGGTAGCVLANRLSENENFSVLLLEVGGVPPDNITIPGFVSTFQSDPNYVFSYESVRQKRVTMGDNNGIARVLVGRGLGGSSSINNMRWNRGTPDAYDFWANMTLDDSWNYANMLEYFKKSETYLGEFPSDQHGNEGPIAVSRHLYAPGRNVWFAAGRELGFDIRDPNGPLRNSFTPVEFSTRNGRRVSSYIGYLRPVLHRKNLKVVTNVYVMKTLFAGDTAIGVRYSTGRNHQGSYFARKEVILSAGVYGSPMLLLRSGIGPKKVLNDAGVRVIKDLPVGESLDDQPVISLQFIINDQSLGFNPERDLTPENLELFENTGEGPYTSTVGYSGQAYMSSSVAVNEGHPNWADIELVLRTSSVPLAPFRNSTLAPWEASIVPILSLFRGRSKGTVKLDPRNIHKPIIDFNYFENPLDEDIFVDAIQKMLRIFLKTSAYRRIGARYLPDALPRCRNMKFASEKYWRCYIREMAIGGNHPTGTCGMTSVVDSSLRVIGMKGIRVVDGSIIPLQPNLNLQAVVYAIAEKAADSIVREWTSKTN